MATSVKVTITRANGRKVKVARGGPAHKRHLAAKKAGKASARKRKRKGTRKGMRRKTARRAYRK